MDEYLNYFFSSSSWSDANGTEKSSWVGSGPAQTNVLIPDTIGIYEGDEKNLPISMIPSGHLMENLALQGTIHVGGVSNCGLDQSSLQGEDQSQQAGPASDSKPSLNGVVNDSSKSEYLGMQFNTILSTLATLNHISPKLLPVVGDSTKSSRSLHESGPLGSNDSEPSEFHQSLRDSQSLPSIPQLWPPPCYSDVSSQSPGMRQHKLQGFGLQEEYVDSKTNVLENGYLGDDKFLQLDNLSASVTINGQDELQNHPLSSFTAGPQISMTRTDGLHSQTQLLQLTEGNPINHCMIRGPVSQFQPVQATAGSGCNGAIKPRMRARRGQATDPHSIAERLRREKIAERMKNLQELVPNSNKGSSGILLSPTSDEGVDLSECPDSAAFEQEVVKLMESNLMVAMQFLQSKGLCLMPTALAAAISSVKTSLGTVSGERKKPALTHGLAASHNNGLLSIGTQQMSSNRDIVTKENAIGNHNKEGITTNGFTGSVVRQEENTSCTAREL
ncbi:hypothetical protein HHK36_005940 [Tetracentron sinense]|uniref:BHLH domain-containing protein n=1 Tax=Tetracentron sinense TaxID=13715 RepID=A0A835DNT1_TETSI|nr:hypothetical protein HHK36_005940 [Tetracentron sinense]